jgi:hypothetical protein
VNGYYEFLIYEEGQFMVQEDLTAALQALGWYGIITESGTIISTPETETRFDFLNNMATEYPGGHTIGFWKTNIAKDLGYLKGHAQLDTATIMGFLANIDDKYGDDFAFLNDLTMYQAWVILSIPDPTSWEDKAEAQILSLVLTAEYYAPDFEDSTVYLPDVGQGSSFTGSGAGAIAYILDLYADGYLAEAQYLADGMNNAPESVIWMDYWNCDITIYAWQDLDGIAGGARVAADVTFHVTSSNGLDIMISTGADGWAKLEDVEPGMYTIVMVVPAGWVAIGQTSVGITGVMNHDYTASFTVYDTP